MRPFPVASGVQTQAAGFNAPPQRVKVSHLTVSGLHGSDQEAPLPVHLGGLGIQVCVYDNKRQRF